MNILVLNCGSSSLKYRLIKMPEEIELAGGEAQRVGPKTTEPTRIYHREAGEEETHYAEMEDHAEAFRIVMKILGRNPELKPDALGHRTVHGGSRFNDHALVDNAAVTDLEEIQHLAPIHNPPALRLLKACREMYPDLPEAVVFDTSYHSTIPEHAYTYALPEEYRNERGIRKYGFHGTSHNFVAAEAARLLGKPFEELNAVSCHLGSGGASLCAIKNGKSIDNTMGYSPLQGLMMSTRSGDLDPAIVLQLLVNENGDAKSVEKQLNKKSGVLGVSGVSSDIRDILSLRKNNEGDTKRINLASNLYLWRIRKYLGAYLTLVGNADAVIFTDTVGETVPMVRQIVCSSMDVFGMKIDPEKNENANELPADVAADDSDVRIMVIRTNEELSIARHTWRLINEENCVTA